jgi:hypothetical protein
MNNWSAEELDKRCKDNPSLARANGIITPVVKSCKGQGFKPNKPTQGDGKPLSQIITNKYHAVKTEYNGIYYPSKKEANTAQDLDLQQKAGSFDFYLRQVNFPLPGGIIYRADFITFAKMQNQITWRIKVIETKGYWTEVAKLKLKLFKETYPNLEIIII